MFVSKAGKVQLIDDGTLPYWQGLGWVETSEADAIAAPTQTNPGGVLTPAAPVGGTSLTQTAVKTTTYSAVAGDLVRADTSGGGFTVTLTAGQAVGAQIGVQKESGDSNTLTIAAASGTINGSATQTTITQWAGVVMQHYGSNVWRIVASMSTTGPAGTNGTNGTNATLSTIEDEGIALTARSNLNFTGAGVTATDAGGKTVITIPGGSATATGLLPRVMQSGRYVTTPGVITNVILADGYEFAFPFEVYTSTTYTKIGLNLQALNGTGVIRLGMRQDNGGYPGTLVAEGATTIDASVATGTTGDKEVNFAQTLAPGIYWLTARQNGGASVQVAGTNNMPVQISSTSTAGTMQNTCTGYNNGGGTTGAMASSWGATYAQQVTSPRVCLKVA